MKDRAILLVDDETDLLEMLQSIFQRAGYTRILTAASGKAALKIWKEAKPSMIILDVMMPGMDGIAVLKEIRRTRPAARRRIELQALKAARMTICRSLFYRKNYCSGYRQL